MARYEITYRINNPDPVIIEAATEEEALDLAASANYEPELPDGFEVEIYEIEPNDYELSDDDIIEEFETDVLPSVIAEYGDHDVPAKCEAFNNWTDMLCKDGRITQWQYENILNPY